ncbi:MAG: Tol-Pal system beta propeller repeat protein TolB [candidate division WOR-3 bacterium]
MSADELWLKLTFTGSRKLLDVVIAQFKVTSGAPAELAGRVTDIRAVFEADLRFSLYFRLEEPDSGRQFSFSTDERRPDLKGWATTGAQILVCGDLVARRTGHQLELRLYDLETARLIARKAYPLSERWRRLAHEMADDVIKLLTGEDGVSCTRICFSQRLGPETKELAVVDYDGAELNQLTGSGGLKLYPDWSPKGNHIAYCAYGRNSLNIYSLELGTHRTTTLAEREGLSTTPAWSPDGRTVAASLTFGGQSELCLMDASGKNIRRLTTGRSIDISPSWSPNGRQLAFVSDRTGTPQVYIINSDGTDLRRVTFEGSYNTSPAWSPKGDLIAFVQRQPDGTNQICVTNILGDTYMRLTHRGNNEEPSWSPDGLHITFASTRTGVSEIYTMDWNGANQRQITKTGGAFSPTWSPRLR